MCVRSDGQSVGRSVGRSVGLFFVFFIYFFYLFILDSVRVRENFDFQLIGGEDWRRIRSEIDAEGLNRGCKAEL